MSCQNAAPGHNTPTNASANTVEFNTCSDFATYLFDRKCPTCSVHFIQDSGDISTLFQSWLSGKATISSQIKCSKCSRASCIACFNKSKAVELPVNGTKIVCCCSRGRLFTVWVMLCGFDLEYCQARRSDAMTKNKTSRNVDRGTGYDQSRLDMTAMFGGREFVGVDRAGMGRDTDRRRALDAERHKDKFYENLFAFLSVLCPSPDHNKPETMRFDVDPPKAVLSMLINSKALDKAAELLRNDSLDNTTKRKNLYMAFFDFLRNIGVHSLSKQAVMFNERIVMPDTINLLTLSFQGLPGNVFSQKASALAKNLRNLNIQSQVMLNGAQKSRHEFQDEQSMDLLWLCREISDLARYLQIGDGDAGPIDHGIVEVPDDQIWPTFHFAREAQMTTQSPMSRVKRLITEVTTLKTGLSSGIYVKHAMSRLDVMKILIAGPKGTPYENGLFEFDPWCTVQFPYEPPKMFFRGTQGGQLWLNPNLHMDGKVCLSLLGTFPGEKWRPGESTILQVLISVQAMIFGVDPLDNIAADSVYKARAERLFSIKTISGLTAKYAILTWARDPPSFWKDVVNLHFHKHSDTILRAVERWAVGASRSNSRSFSQQLPSSVMGNSRNEVDFATVLPQLQAALQGYGATYVPQRIASSTSQQHPSSGRTGYGSQMPPHGGGGRFNGSGGLGGYGGPGTQVGRGL